LAIVPLKQSHPSIVSPGSEQVVDAALGSSRLADAGVVNVTV
jgi:hypothetical protein